MKKDEIAQALDQLDDAILQEADAVRTAPKKKNSPHRWIWAAAAAACLALAVFAGARLWPADLVDPIAPQPSGQQGSSSQPSNEQGTQSGDRLPMLTIGE